MVTTLIILPATCACLTDDENLRYLKYKQTYKQNTNIHINNHDIQYTFSNTFLALAK